MVVLTSTEWVAKQANSHFAQYACLTDSVSPVLDPDSMKSGGAIEKAIEFAKLHKLLPDGKSDVIVIADDSNGAIGLSHYTVN